MENIIQFLIDESRRYLRAKNSHNLTLKKIQDSPIAAASGKKRGMGAAPKHCLRHGVDGFLCCKGVRVDDANGGGSGEPRLPLQHAAGPATSLHTCTAGGVRVEAAMRGSGTEPLLPLQHVVDPPQTLPPTFTARGVRVDPRRWRAAGRAPLLPRQQSQLRVEQ